jgi:molecular chaperone GrpE
MGRGDSSTRNGKGSGEPEDPSLPEEGNVEEGRTQAGGSAERVEGPGKAPEGTSPEQDWRTRYLYLLADFDNYRKRSERDLRLVSDRARASLLLKVIRLYDGLERARDSLPPGENLMRQGLGSLLQNFAGLLSEEGIQPVAREGEPFRAEEHEAVGELPVTPSHPAGSVANVVLQGYRAPYGLLRAAKVLVAKEAPPGPSAPAEGTGKAQEPSGTPSEEDP